MDPAAPVPIERLLEHRAWVRTLARALVADANRADDVEQDAWLAAMTHPPRHDAGLKTWLARLVRHRASNARRAEARRETHERTVFEPTHDADPTDAVARIEELERVVRAVLALEEPYRSTVVLRFYEDLDAHAIAERTGAPVETVRTRLKRALAQLRGRLDDDHGGDGRAWSAALLPLAGGKSALVTGGLAVTAKAKVAVAAVVLVALTVSVVVLAGREAPPPIVVAEAPAPIAPPVVVEAPLPPPAPAPVAVQRVVAPALVVAPPPVEMPPAPKPKAAPVVVVEPVGTGAVFGAVRYATTRASVAGQKVALEAVGATTLTVATDAKGGFRFEHLAEGRSWRVRVEAANYAPVVVPNLHLDRDETRDVGTLWLDVPVRFDVVVKDWRDRPIAGATVGVYPQRTLGVSNAFTQAGERRHVMEPVATATSGADGRAVLPALPRGDWTVLAGAAGHAPAYVWIVSLAPGPAKREVTVHLDKGLRIEGRVVGGDRKPVARAAVWAYERDKSSVVSYMLPRATTDDAGRFVLDGLRPGETTLRVGRDGATPGAVEQVRVPAASPVEIVLDGGIVDGVVTSESDGKPLVGARVLAYLLDERGATMVEATSGEDGRYRLDTLRPCRPSMFRVERAGFVTIEESSKNVMCRPETTFRSAPTTRDFAMRHGVPLAGLVTSPDGPIAGARVVAWWWGRKDDDKWLVSDEGFTDGDGRFALTTAGSQTVVVQVFADGWFQEGLADFNWSGALMNGKKPPHAIDVPARGLPDVSITMTRGCVVSGRVTSTTGAPVAGATVSCSWERTTTSDDGTFSLTATVTGRSATISAGDGRSSASQPIELSAAGRVDGVVLRLARTARVGGRVTTSSGAAVDDASVELIFRPTKPEMGQREWAVAHVPVAEGGRYEAEFVEQDGGFHVRASAPGFASAESPQTSVETGRATYHADVVLAPSQTLEGRVVSSADGFTPIVGARIALLPGSWDRDQNRRRRQTLAVTTDEDGRFRILDVEAGDAQLDVDADGFVRATTPVKVPTLPGFTLKIDPSFEMAGVVKLPGGASVADVWDGSVTSGIWVMLHLENDREHRYWSTAVGLDGRFRMTGLARGTYTVSVSVRGGTVSVARFETKGVPAGKTDVEFVLSAAGTIAGRVLAPDGRPLGGCMVQAFADKDGMNIPPATTKDDGTFVVLGIGEGTYHLEAKPPEAERTGYVTQGAQLRAAKATGVAAGATNVEIRLTGGLTIRGVFLDAAGKPLVDAWLRAEVRPGQEVEPGVDSWFLGPGAQTDASGKFTISGLATAHYRLVHVPDPQNVVVARPLKGGDDVASGATNVRVVAGNLSTISGTVVDEDGKPVADASVDLIVVGGRPAASVRTDAAGVFTIRDASDVGRYVVRASKFERVPAQTDDVVAGATGVSIRLVRGREASGRVLQRDGTPFADGFVRLVLDGGDYSVSARTDAEGRFTAKALKDGVYRVEASMNVIRPGQPPRACGTIRAGARDVELRMTE